MEGADQQPAQAAPDFSTMIDDTHPVQWRIFGDPATCRAIHPFPVSNPSPLKQEAGKYPFYPGVFAESSRSQRAVFIRPLFTSGQNGLRLPGKSSLTGRTGPGRVPPPVRRSQRMPNDPAHSCSSGPAHTGRPVSGTPASGHPATRDDDEEKHDD